MLLDTTEILACPACGPPNGLIVLVDEATGRRVRRGVLGCPMCAGRFPIDEGHAVLGDLILEDRAAEPEHRGGSELTLMVAALGDLAATIGPVLLDPGLEVDARRLNDLAPGVELVSLRSPDPAVPVPTPRLPVLDRSFAAAATRADGPYEVSELRRVVRPGGRVLVFGGAVSESWIQTPGWQLVASDDRVIVLARED